MLWPPFSCQYCQQPVIRPPPQLSMTAFTITAYSTSLFDCYNNLPIIFGLSSNKIRLPEFSTLISQLSSMVICNSDRDWFTFNVFQNGKLYIKSKPKRKLYFKTTLLVSRKYILYKFSFVLQSLFLAFHFVPDPTQSKNATPRNPTVNNQPVWTRFHIEACSLVKVKANPADSYQWLWFAPDWDSFGTQVLL